MEEGEEAKAGGARGKGGVGKRAKEEKEGRGREGGEICNEMGLNKTEILDIFFVHCVFTLESDRADTHKQSNGACVGNCTNETHLNMSNGAYVGKHNRSKL